MAKMQVCTTYTNPEQLGETRDEFGRRVVGRIPKHPTRPARRCDNPLLTWWQDVGTDEAIDLARAGAIVRVTPSR